MKKLIVLSFTALTMSTFANGLDVAHLYQDAIDAHKVEQNTKKAKIILEGVLGDISNDHPLFEDIYKSYLDYSGAKTSDNLGKAIQFATGRKEETFCKNIGLVFSKLFHNDGTVSRLFLGNGKRLLAKDSYSVMYDGRWNYQLDTEYRKPTKSEVWINSGDENHYDIQEVRKTPLGIDKGKWFGNRREASFSISYSTTGQTKEPIPMYMAVDYHAWGTPDLGYQINFIVGESQPTHSAESSFGHGKILLTGNRTVKKKLNFFKIKDLDNKIREYNDCYLVETKIKFAGLGKKHK